MKRSYADVASAVAPNAHASQPAETTPQADQLQQVAQALLAASPQPDVPVPEYTTPTSQPTPPKVVELRATKKALEEALAAVPAMPETMDIRRDLQTKIDEQTYAIRAAAPIGAQLDGAKVALSRASARSTSP